MKIKYIAEETIKTEKEETLLDILNQEDDYDRETIEYCGENYKVIVDFSASFKKVSIQKLNKTRKYIRMGFITFDTDSGLSNEEIAKKVEEIFKELESQEEEN